MPKSNKFIVSFSQVDRNDIGLVGGKGANLGELTKFGAPVPPGFIVTSRAYFYFLEETGIKRKIADELSRIKDDDPTTLQTASARIEKLVTSEKVPKDLAVEIMKAYASLGGPLKDTMVAVRSSATAEDLPEASFAGQQATFLNVFGEANLVKRVKDCWASLFTPRAIFYREQHKFNHLKVGIAVPVQLMVQSEISGVMFTINPVSGEKNQIVIEAIWGLGELIVQGAVNPDRYIVSRDSGQILSVEVFRQSIQLIKVDGKTKEVSVRKSKQDKQKLGHTQIKQLAKVGSAIHNHYYFPQDIEWAYSKGKFYMLQTRPVTALVEERMVPETSKEGELFPKSKLLLKGTPASPGIARGPVRKIKTAKEIGKIKKGDVLVTGMTTPDFVPAMKRTVAIVTDRGGQTSHAAIVSRELGIPCVVGAEGATKKLKNGQIITVHGGQGTVYQGALETGAKLIERKVNRTKIPLVKTATKIYVNLAEPELAQEAASLPVDGVGLLRAEFMISEQVGTHPRKLIKDKKGKEFSHKLASGLATFCRAFSPRPVVYRTTDFKTSEYRNLVGGKSFEPEEENPLLGFRGAFRYIRDEAVFDLELEAINQVRRKMGFKNLWLMIPFVRTVQELTLVKRLIAAKGLVRSPSFKLWLMVEIPSNVVLLSEYAGVGLDGISIGSNDLTMLMLGADRDNAELAQVFNEQDPAVLWALEKVVKDCHKLGLTSSICGQAPSVYPELVEKLVEWGITSVSVSPDAVERTREIVAESERKRAKQEE